MTKTEIIQETYNYYTQDPKRRGIQLDPAGNPTARCLYKNIATGSRCAVGRCLVDEVVDAALHVFNNSYGSVGNMFESQWNELETLLKPEYKGHSQYFWEQLQNFHDDPNNWGKEGITEQGKRLYQGLLREFKNQ